MSLLNNDVLENILARFSYPELACLRGVSKQFQHIASGLYLQKRSEMQRESSKIYFEYIAEANRCRDMTSKAVCFTRFVDRFLRAKCWPILIENHSFREGLFFLCARYDPYHTFEYDAIHDRMRPYMFLNSTRGLDTASMRKLLRYKKTPRVSKMSKRQLQSRLLAPKYKSFVWEY